MLGGMETGRIASSLEPMHRGCVALIVVWIRSKVRYRYEGVCF